MSQLGLILQESLRTEREAARTILGLLTEQMEGVVDTGPRRRRTLKERFGLAGIGGCCGATWSFRPATLTARHGETEEEQEQSGGGGGGAPPPLQQQPQDQETNPVQDPISSGPDCVAPTPAGSGMNLAAALAAERQLRGTQEPDAAVRGSAGDNLGGGGAVPGTPWRVSLMRLLEETEVGDAEAVVVTETETEKGGAVAGNDTVCCVCMGRKKGAAFIPCGHTFCRVCSRELWLNRGSCPLCNRSILEILDIF